MTRINKLTQNPELLADDLFVIWDNDNQRTRSITAETLNKFTDANGANAQAFVNGYIQDGVLYMVRANGEVVNIGSITGVELLAEGSIPKVENGKLVASAVKETDDAVVFTKDIIAPQESVFVGPAVKISDKGGYLGVDNLADDRESTPVVSFVYETEAERDAIFEDGVSVPKYRYFVPAKWVYQFPFEAEYSNANKLSFEFQDTDNTLIRKFRMFSQKAQSGVRIWIENLLPSGDALVWENVSEDDFDEGKGQDFVAQGDTDQFTLVESGLVKISTANIRFRFNVQAQPGENLELQGQEIDLGFGTGFYPRMVTYTQDEKDLDLLDSIETSQNRFGQFGEQFRIETSDIVARDLGDQAEAIPQGIFDTAITSDRPEATYVNGDKPIQINAITVKHIGTWSPVQVSLNDDRSQVVDLVDGDNTITFTKPLTVEANQSVYFRFTGAVGTGSQTQISLRGDAQQEIYYKLDITELDEKTVTVNGVESVVAGNKIFVDDSDPKNPIVSWDPSGDLLPGVNINKDGAQVLSAADTLNFSGSFDVVKAKDTGGTVNIELSQTARGSNFVGLFADTSELTTKYPSPEDGLYAEVLQGNGELPDDRYESKGGSWIGMGGVAGQVIVDGSKTAGLIIGDGLKTTEDGGSKTISTSGKVNIVELDVDADPTITLDSSYAGKLMSITQSASSTPKVMVITLNAYDSFQIGDTLTIARSEEYINHYFTVYYTAKNGQQRAVYPARNVTFISTSKGWDFSKDGYDPKFSAWPVINVGIGDSPKVIESVDDVGYEYVYQGSEFSQSAELFEGVPEGSQIKISVDDYTKTDKPVEVTEIKTMQTWYITTPTIFIHRNGKWRVQESSQMIHIEGATTFGTSANKSVVNAITTTPTSGIVMAVNEQGVLVIDDSENPTPTFKTISIDTNGSGQPNFTAEIKQDNELHTVIDATRGLRINYKDIGTGATSTVLGVDNNQLQSLVPIYVGNDKVATSGENTFTKKQTIQMDSIGDALKVNRLNGGPLLTVNNGLQSSSVTYTKTLEEYEEEAAPYDLINKTYLAANYLPRNNPWIARDVAVFGSNMYHTGSEFFSNANYFYLKTGATISTGNLAFDEETMSWTGDIVDFGRMLEDSIEFDKATIKNLKTDSIITAGGNVVIKHTNAELNHLEVAYQGKYGENRVHYPCVLQQGSSGRVNFDFTRELKFTYKNPSSGSTDSSSVLTLSQTGATYEGDTTQPNNPITREALDNEPQKEWFVVANGTLTTNGNRPTGGSGVEGELAVWHNVTSDSTTDPANELKVLFDGAYDKVDAFSKPLRFRLSQQGGTRNQYWTVDDNGWQTEGNVWHLSATKVTGDNLVVGIDTIVQASALFLNDEVEPYHGQGVGVPSHVFIGNGTNPTQTKPVALYANSSNDASSRGDITLSKEEGYDEFEVIIDCLTKPTRDFRIKAGELGMYSDKRIRTSEVWSCRIKVDWNNSTNSNFYWTRLDNGASGYILEEKFNAKSGYDALISGGGSTKTVTYADNAKILKITNSTVKVELLQDMNAETRPHGYFKYINSHNADVSFEWYDRKGAKITNNVPSVCPKDTVVEVFADYAKDEYVLNFSQSKVISSTYLTIDEVNERHLQELTRQTRFGAGTLEIDSLNFLVEGFTANNLNIDIDGFTANNLNIDIDGFTANNLNIEE